MLTYLDSATTVVAAATIFLLPLIFFTGMTDFFILPKQILIIASTALILVFWSIKVILMRKVEVVLSPLNLPLILFGAVILISAIISPNRYDALMQSIPLVATVVFALAIFNSVRTRGAFSAVLSAYILGGAVSAIVSVLFYFKVYIIPIASIQSQFFSTQGSTFQELIYLIPVFIFSAVYLAKKLNFPKIKIPASAASDYGFYIQAISFVAVLLGIAVIVFQILTLPNKPILLPYIYGFQTAFASISQDAGRFIWALLFGSGYGTFLSDFTRYKLVSFNLEQNIWNLSFSFSSSYVLELIATTGILGLLSYFAVIFSFIRLRTAQNPLFASIFVAIILSFILPYSFVAIAGLLVLIGIYVTYLNLEGSKKVYDVALYMVARKSGMFAFETQAEGERKPQNDSVILPAVIALLVLLLVGFVAFYSYKFTSSDIKFASSLKAAQANNAQSTYQLEVGAINEFPFRSDYHRIFSQVNLALANSLASGIKQGSSPSADVQQNIVTLLQQSINSGRNAVTLSPRNSVNWQNLGTIYRNLINVGQNADQFSVASYNQAIALDPYNPDLYIALGGVYYQLGLWDQAAQQFQVAINLKRDYANAYYNLGHAYESKGDLQNALAAYQAVKQLSAANDANVKKIDEEIKALQDKIGSAANNQPAASNVTPQTEQTTPLSVSEPTTVLPTQKPPVKISPPPAGKVTPSAAPTPAQ